MRRDAGKRVLVAGVGNVLRGDDGFGPAVARALETTDGLPEDVRVVEVGIGGIALVHELMAGYDLLVIVDAVDRGDPPGTLSVLEPRLPELPSEGDGSRSVITADMHEVVPERVLLLARALGLLPPRVRIVGCQPLRVDDLSLELSPEVERSVPGAAAAVLALVDPDRLAGGRGEASA
jgi:hydrogenase maturation protease